MRPSKQEFMARSQRLMPPHEYKDKYDERPTDTIKLEWHEVLGLIERMDPAMNYHGDADWAGSTVKQLKEEVKRGGDGGIIKASQELLDKVQMSLHLPTPGPVPDLAIVGGSPNMAAYYSGSPACMNGLDEEEDNHSLIRVICDISTSWSVSDDSIYKRAGAVTALVRVMSMYRPIEFWVASCGKVGGHQDADTACMVRVSAHPIDISAVATAMSQPFARLFCYGVEYSAVGCEDHDDGGGLGWARKTVAGCIGIGGYGAKDIVIPPLHTDEEAEYGKDPVGWVKRQVEEAVIGEGQAHASLRGHDDDD